MNCSACLDVTTNMADGSQATVSNSVQSKANTSVASSTQPQTSQPSTSSTSATTTSHVDTKVRNAGASLAEFLTQLDDYTPTVNIFPPLAFTCSHASISLANNVLLI